MTPKIFSPGGTEHITALIAEAVANESRTATVSGCWIVDEAIRIPGNFTLILENCHLRQADGCFANIFVNEHHDTPIGRTPAGTDRNIAILGRGEAILDGGEYNGLSEKTQLSDGMPPIWKNNMILFTNVDGFRISGLSCRSQRWWALNFIYCAHGYLGHLDFCANDSAVDAVGNLYHGLRRDRYAEVLVKNADGIDLRQGCHDIEIEHITGFTEDDTVALTGLHGRLEQAFAVDGLPADICRVSIRDVASAAYCTNVRLLNQGEVKLHDILIDGVCDASADCPHLDHGRHAVRVGATHLYGSRHSTGEETYNITIRNIYSAGQYAIALAGEISNLVLYAVECAPGTKMLLDRRGQAE